MMEMTGKRIMSYEQYYRDHYTFGRAVCKTL